MKGFAGFCVLMTSMMGSVGFAAENPARSELKVAYGLQGCAPRTACCGYSSCGYSGCGYSSCGYMGGYPTTIRYPSYGYGGYSNCGPAGCFPTAPVMYPQVAPTFPQSYPAPYGGYSAPVGGYPSSIGSYGVPMNGYSVPSGYTVPSGYAPYSPVNYPLPYGAKAGGTITAGYRAPVNGNSPFYP